MDWANSQPRVQRIRGRRGVERRASWLRKHPLCCKCEADGRVKAATDLDHVVPLSKGGADDETNFQSLCSEHHKAKTAVDMGHNTKPQIGVDGWPEAPSR